MMLRFLGINFKNTLKNARSFAHGVKDLKMDFSEKINTNEIILKNPDKLKKMNMCQSINNALDLALKNIPNSFVYGEDVKFGGVFRCTVGLHEKYGGDRVFNTPLSEQGIIGFSVGLCAAGGVGIAEIQFADYIFPAFDQFVNEVAKYRYRSANQFNVGGLTVRSAYGHVGHGGSYHSQAPEGHFIHAAGLTIVIPRSALQAKGLLLASIKTPDPVIFFEPKILYRMSEDMVPEEDYTIPLRKAEIVKEGKDVTIVGYGEGIRQMIMAQKMVEDKGISCELIDLRTVFPFDFETIQKSVKKTERVILVSEASYSGNVMGEIAAKIAESTLFNLRGIKRVCGFDIPFPFVYEPFHVPNRLRIEEAILDIMQN